MACGKEKAILEMVELVAAWTGLGVVTTTSCVERSKPTTEMLLSFWLTA
jgi:hypothetical protein